MFLFPAINPAHLTEAANQYHTLHLFIFYSALLQRSTENSRSSMDNQYNDESGFESSHDLHVQFYCGHF